MACSFTIDVRLQVQKKAIESVRMVLPQNQLTKGHSIAHKHYNTFSTISATYYRYQILCCKAIPWWQLCTIYLLKIPYIKSFSDALEQRFDGSRDSLRDKFHRPISTHPSAHTDMELKWINDLHRRNPHISICEMYGVMVVW